MAEKKCALNFNVQQKKFCLSLNYNGANSFLFIKAIDIYKLNAEASEVNAALLYLDNVLKDFSSRNMKKTGLYSLDMSW